MEERHTKTTCDNCGTQLERDAAGHWPEAKILSVSVSLAAPPEYGDPKRGYTSATQTYTKTEGLLCRTCEQLVRGALAVYADRWEEARRA